MTNQGAQGEPGRATDAAERGTDRPTPAEMQDEGAHDRGGWLTLDEAAQRFGVPRQRLEQGLREGRMAGRRIAAETLSPSGAPAEAVVPEGALQPPSGPKDDWLVQPDQVERLLEEEQHGQQGT
ncbi:MAG TPA: hypothetical protein VHS99_08710 [Chloroflexota bacterium]|jgi:hypothetical protein|nr:hypothetical protein [Chloroflexota bacterium]